MTGVGRDISLLLLMEEEHPCSDFVKDRSDFQQEARTTEKLPTKFLERVVTISPQMASGE
jgi:hypothetical protein